MKAVTLCLLFCFSARIFGEVDHMNVTKLSEKIRIIVENSLKKTKLQNHIQSLSYEERRFQEDATSSLAAAVSNRIIERSLVVKNLHQTIVEALLQKSNKSSWLINCCNISTAIYNPIIQIKADTSRSCFSIPLGTPPSVLPLRNLSFNAAAKENFKNIPRLKMQYYAVETGVVRFFPSIRSRDCLTVPFDARLRPWYVHAYAPGQKHVVIVIDKSGSMNDKYFGIPLMLLAKQAANSVISTLSSRDKFAVIAFSSSLATATSATGEETCFSYNLAPATSPNKAFVRKFVDSIQAEGGTLYGNALVKAFQFLQTEVQGDIDTSINRVILFMSDGAPEDTKTSIMNKLRAQNQLLNNTVVLMTYGVGSEDFSILEDIAIDNPDISKRGRFVPVADPRRLRNAMSAFYKVFAQGGENVTEPIWSAPFLDYLTAGLVVAGSLPVYSEGVLMGVVGVIEAVKELYGDVAYFKPSEHSYAFLIDGKGFIISHNSFPYTQESESIFVLATAFEQDPEFIPIFESMKRGESGNTTFNATRFVDGIERKKILSRYIWKQVTSTNLSLCVVFAYDTAPYSLRTTSKLLPGSTLFHRMDLLPPSAPCNHLGSFSSLNQTAVYMAPRAFTSSEAFQGLTYRLFRKDVEEFLNYIEENGTNKLNVKEEVKREIIATEKAQTLWLDKSNLSALNEYILWRFIATDNGAFRVYPAVKMPPSFDPTTTFWYRKAVLNPNQHVVNTPTYDPRSRSYTITISHALFHERENNGKIIRIPFGVIGVDIILDYFFKMYSDLYEVSASTIRKTYLLDNEGFVIYDNEYHNLINKNANFTVKHMAEVEPQITSILIQEGVLLRINCSLIELGLIQRKYMISIEDAAGVNATYRVGEENVYEFVLEHVPDTNTYVLFRTKISSEDEMANAVTGYAESCSCTSVDTQLSQTCETSWTNLNECECPCIQLNQYFDSCKSEYSISSPPPCIARVNVRPDQDPTEEKPADDLPACYSHALLYQSNYTWEIIGLIISLVSCFVIFILFVGVWSHYKKKRVKAQQRVKSAMKRQKDMIKSKNSMSVAAVANWVSKISNTVLHPGRVTSVESHG